MKVVAGVLSLDSRSDAPKESRRGRPALADGFLFALILIAAFPAGAGAQVLTLTGDPGQAGSSFFYQDFHYVGALNGTAMEGQTESLDFLFTDDKFAVAGRFTFGLDINQSDEMGVWPTSFSQVTAYLLDASGTPSSAPLDFAHTLTMPTQVWPGWGYYLPDDTEYLPATTGYSGLFSGSIVDPLEDGSYYLDPVRFSGIRFEVTLPDTPSISVLGLRVRLSNYSDYYQGEWHNPIYVSPNVVAPFFVPEPSTLTPLGLGSLALVVCRRRRRLVRMRPGSND